jgi:hypothetical protein
MVLILVSDEQCDGLQDVLDCHCDFATAQCAKGCNAHAIGYCEELCDDYNGLARCDCSKYNLGGSMLLLLLLLLLFAFVSRC